jgi:hypothetical protein
MTDEIYNVDEISVALCSTAFELPNQMAQNAVKYCDFFYSLGFVGGRPFC